MRPASVTHNFDQNQRRVPLGSSQGSGFLQVTAPTDPDAAPPGYYMLFLVDSAGVPSEARFVQLTNQVAAVPSLQPTMLGLMLGYFVLSACLWHRRRRA